MSSRHSMASSVGNYLPAVINNLNRIEIEQYDNIVKAAELMGDDIKEFRRREAINIVSKPLKAYNSDLEITYCVHATLNGYYVSEYRGYDRWDTVALSPYIDVFAYNDYQLGVSRILLQRSHTENS